MSISKRQHIQGPFGPSFQPSTLIELLRFRAANQPGQTAYTYLLDGEGQATQINYQELERRALAVAARLQEGRAAGERILLLYPPGLEFHVAFMGCIYAGAIAVPAYPPRINRNLIRLNALVADAQASTVLTTAPILLQLQAMVERVPSLARLQWLATDNLTQGEAGWREPQVGPEAVAFLQYTSGSTGTPRGVVVTHANLLANAEMVYNSVEHSQGDAYVSWLPTFHDMGFMAGMLQPLYAGIPSVLLSPVSFLQSPLRWLQAVSKYRATISGGPNFAYDLCVRKIPTEQRRALDLSSWTVAFNGAEPIRSDTLESFAAAFAPCGFRKEAFFACYGLAEATLMVSGGRKREAPIVRHFENNALEKNRAVDCGPAHKASRPLVSCGRTLGGQRVAIADAPSLAECPPGEVGEIWVAGPSVAQGYWHNPEETERVFHAFLSDSGEGPFLRTGDLGFMLDGELFVTGRLKDLIIIRGVNHYPHDIELTVEKCHPALRPGGGAAFSVVEGGEEQLVIVQEVDERAHPRYDRLTESIRQAVAEEHEVQAHSTVLIKKGTIPKTSSGKIQRHACRAAYLSGDLKEVTRDTLGQSRAEGGTASFIRSALLAVEPAGRQPLLEMYLKEQLGHALKTAPSQFSADQPLTAFGIDSLTAVELKNSVERDLGVSLSLTSLLAGASLADLGRQASEQLNAPASPVALARSAAPQAEAEQPLSYTQQSLWFLYQVAPDSPAYNVPFALRILSELDARRLKDMFQALTDRHQCLRTTFKASDGDPVQIIHQKMDVYFQELDASLWSDEKLASRLTEEVHRPFDLERGPVFRVHLFKRSATDYVLLATAHHIIIDGWSFWLMLDEIGSLYEARSRGVVEALPEPALQYTDFVHWQAERLNGPEGERLWGYWQKELSGDLPALDLPTSRTRPPIQTYSGAAHAFAINEELTAGLKALAGSRDATLYMVLLAAFKALLHRYTGLTDIVVGSPISARTHAALEKVIGCFFNAVVLRTDLGADPAFTELLDRVRGKVLAALEHQDYPAHLLAERLQPHRDPSRPSLFQVTFILQKAHGLAYEPKLLLSETSRPLDLGGLSLKLLPVEKRFARTDLELEMIEADGRIAAWFQYNTDLFDADSIARMADHFQTLLSGVVRSPSQRLSELPLLSEPERQQALYEWSNLGRDYASPVTVRELFEEQVRKTPDKVAAVYGDASLSFEQLSDQAEKLATLLKELRK